MCEDVIEYSSNAHKICLALSEYTDKHYKEFKSKNVCLDNSDEDNLYKYYVSEECNLYNMPKTFPEYNPQKRQILYENNSRTAINKCISTTESVSPEAKEKGARNAENGAGDEEKPAETEDADVRSRLDDNPARLADDPAHLTKLSIQLRTGHLIGEDAMTKTIEGDPNEEIMQPKVGTIGATLAGSSLFLIMMYKYTPLGSWVSTRILGRNKLMENMRKNNYELLLNDVGDRDANLNDTMYHIRYNSSSNQ
ncbi:Plasmodium vivax Vir protein, putative [Plasmodium vivax]|nr:Plasmodium vivax Vir protein, putative [Plasmodium vivax]